MQQFSPVELRGELVEPHRDLQDSRLPETPFTAGSPYPFTLAFCHTWEFYEADGAAKGGEWLPEYREIRHVDGGNGVRVGAGGRLDAGAAVFGMMSKGAIPMPLGDPRLGPYRNYLVRYEKRGARSGGRRTGFFYCFAPISMALINGGREAVPNHSAETRAWILGLRRQMLVGQIVPPMPAHTLDTHVQRSNERIRRWLQMVERGQMAEEASSARRQSELALIDRMRAAWTRQFGAARLQAIATAPVAAPESIAPDADVLAAVERGVGAPLREPDPQPSEDKAELMAAVAGLEMAIGPDGVLLAREQCGMNPETPLQRFGLDKLARYLAILEEVSG